jgi:hypothetical protein
MMDTLFFIRKFSRKNSTEKKPANGGLRKRSRSRTSVNRNEANKPDDNEPSVKVVNETR